MTPQFQNPGCGYGEEMVETKQNARTAGTKCCLRIDA